MHAPVYTCRADDDIEAAARIMREHRVRRLPVVDAATSRSASCRSTTSRVRRAPVIDSTPGLTADELGDVYDATSGRSKHELSHLVADKIHARAVGRIRSSRSNR